MEQMMWFTNDLSNKNPNHNYQVLANDFLEKYFKAIMMGVFYASHYYGTDSLISLRIIHNNNNVNKLFEFVGYNNFRNKLAEMNVSSITFNNVVTTNQPLGKNNVIINFYSKAEINKAYYNVMSSITIKISTLIPKITNQTLQIFV